MGIVLIHFDSQHLRLYCLFLGNACKISSGFFAIHLSHALQSCFTCTPQIWLSHDNSGEIIASNILQARGGLNLLKFLCFRRLNKVRWALSFKYSSETLKIIIWGGVWWNSRSQTRVHVYWEICTTPLSP